MPRASYPTDDVPFDGHDSSDDLLSAEPAARQRPGRFYGPDKTWKLYTHPARELAVTLGEEECNDLSSHLYNAHMLKRRGYPPTHDTRHMVLTPKRRWLQADANNHIPFHPPSQWTAWPMQSHHVPRRRETWGTAALWHEHDEDENSQGMFLRQESWLPSRDLQEELEVVILRRAHKNLQQQKASSEPGTRLDRSSRAETPQPHQSSDAGESSTTSETNSERKTLSTLSDGTTTDEKRKVTPSQRSVSSAEPSPRFVSLPSPSMLLDDELAATALRPSVRECMSRLNCILDALHRSRKGSRESVTQSGNQPPDLPRAKRRRRETSVKADQSSLDTKPRPAAFVSHPSEPIATISDPRNTACRDWSEILSLAITTGWDQAAVERTARRCANLFGETMELRFIPAQEAPRIHGESFTYEPVASAPTVSKRSAATRMSDASRTYACSYSRCERHHKPFMQRWELRQHLKRSHMLHDTDIGSVVTAADDIQHREGREARTDVESRHNTDEDDVLCPITICMPNSRR